MVITQKNLLESGLLSRFNGYGDVHVMEGSSQGCTATLDG